MRKLIAITLLAVFGLPFITPLMALGSTSEANLPACCRRNGKHHCMMNMAERARLESRKPHFQAPPEHCPYWPTQVAMVSHSSVIAPPIGQAIFAGLVSHTADTSQVESWLRISRERSRYKRGPPVTFL